MKAKRIGLSILLLAIVGLIVYNIAGPADLLAGESSVYATPLSLLPPVIAITLALITKEVYTSLFIGVLTGALLYTNGSLERTMNTMLFNEDGSMVSKLADSGNVGILIFLVLLGIMVAMMNTAGGSSAFGRWASKHIKTRVGAQLATMALGVLIFVDDYFNCLTVGSVMRPVTDRHKISRAKLSYLIDATAAPVCIIAPISSWAAAVTSSVPEEAGINGFAVFLQTIPYNLYALLTLAMILFITFLKVDFGSMKKHEWNAIKGDLFTTPDRPYEETSDAQGNPNARVADLIIPVVVLIATCVFGMIYTGGFFEGTSFIDAFANSSASVGLVIGGFITLLFTFFYYMLRGVITFKEFSECIPEGFKAMVAPILILTLAWTLSGMTNLLGAKVYVSNIVSGSAQGFQGSPSHDCLPDCCVLSICNRYKLGYLRYSYPHRAGRIPFRTDDGHFHCLLPCRCRLRRPLLSHFRHHHHGFRRRSLQPHQPCCNPASLCIVCCGILFHRLCHHGHL